LQTIDRKQPINPPWPPSTFFFFATHQLQTANQSTAASINLLFFFATDQSQMAD